MAKGKIVLDQERCKGCELCVHVCPQGILRMAGELNKKGFHPVEISSPQECTGCAFCYDICPDTVIEVYREASRGKKVQAR